MPDTLEEFWEAILENTPLPEAPREGGELVLWKSERLGLDKERIEPLFRGFGDVAQARRCATRIGPGRYYVSNDFGTLAEFVVDA